MGNDHNLHLPEESSFQRLWSELKGCHDARLAMVCAIVGWLVVQAATGVGVSE